MTSGGYASAGRVKMRSTWKLWTTIENYENEQDAPDSFGRNTPRGIYEAARPFPKRPGTGLERAAAPDQRNRVGKTRHLCGYRLAAGPLLRHERGNVDGLAGRL